MKKQRGFGLGGFIVALILLAVGALLLFKLLPPYIEYFSIQKTFKTLAADPELQSGNRREIRNAFSRHATIENIRAITSDDIEISKAGAGITVSARYQERVPLMANISLVIDFSPTSASD